MTLKCIENHTGFSMNVRKPVIIQGTGYDEFQVHDMQEVVAGTIQQPGKRLAVFRGKLEEHRGDSGNLVENLNA